MVSPVRFRPSAPYRFNRHRLRQIIGGVCDRQGPLDVPPHLVDDGPARSPICGSA
jgi:hypothetical protein